MKKTCPVCGGSGFAVLGYWQQCISCDGTGKIEEPEPDEKKGSNKKW
jgi:RecJ-like exonuclease